MPHTDISIKKEDDKVLVRADNLVAIVTRTDDGVVCDITNKAGEVVASTYAFFHEHDDTIDEEDRE